MKKYLVGMQKDGTVKYYYIRNLENYEIELLPTKYLAHKTKSRRSPNTVRRSAFALSFYLEYLSGKELDVTDVLRMKFTDQTEVFIDFLYWLKQGKHKEENDKTPRNGTCNAYLKDVFRFYLFIEMEYQSFGSLKVLSYNQFITPNAVGVRKVIKSHSFHGYLKEEERDVKPAEQDEIVRVLQACTNCRDQLLILLIAETGFRIGEILGVDYIRDIDYENHLLKVYFRDDNENDARAKNAEYRKAKISDDTFEFLIYYLSEYRKELQCQNYLFINITGDTAGKPLKVDSVYDMFTRMEKKTNIKITPHMLRRYFANSRREAGWPLELIQKALGHKHLETTVKYLNIVDDELLDASQRYYEQQQPMYGIEKLL